MDGRVRLIAIVVALVFAAGWSEGPRQETVAVSGVQSAVRILRDPWGVPHIFAQSEGDLFFAQGFSADRDRLFQLELWRRAATGTMAEVVGEKALERDVGARLLAFRGDLEEELRHYHPRGPAIVRSFVAGINAHVELVRNDPARLPLEFRLLGIRPGLWTPEVVVSRHNGLFRNARQEVRLARLASRAGLGRMRELVEWQPRHPPLEEAEDLDLASIPDGVLDLYRASRARFDFQPEDIVENRWRAQPAAPSSRAAALDFLGLPVGSNNWVVAPWRSQTGKALLANDPHRSLQTPSLRYFAHLSAPGWEVIGGGEPALPGISIGHNGFGAWGLTIFPVDQEDLYSYRTHPDDPSRYLYRGEWEEMSSREELFRVEGGEPVHRTLRFTRHGPVLYQDAANQRAYALRAAWLEVGSAPYLASLRFGQARSWQDFRDACSFVLAPSENMLWADVEGNIGWQATGITPLRPNWSGLLPVPGDGRYEWAGTLPVLELPHSLNPPEGILATANQYNLPAGYPHRVGYSWTPPFRYARILESLAARPLLGMADMVQLQTDVLSLPARGLVPLLNGLEAGDGRVEAARRRLLDWDFRMDADSPAAALFALWQRRLVEKTWDLHLPAEIREDFEGRTLSKTLEWLRAPDGRFGPQPVRARDRLLLDCLEEAAAELAERLGDDPEGWRYGHEKLHHARIPHLLSDAVKQELRGRLDAGPLPRPGDRYTVNMTTGADNQRSGASFRLIVDLADWDRSLASNAPGQSGDPDSPHYRDLFEDWARDRYFPLLYSRERIEEVAREVLVLTPRQP